MWRLSFCFIGVLGCGHLRFSCCVLRVFGCAFSLSALAARLGYLRFSASCFSEKNTVFNILVLLVSKYGNVYGIVEGKRGLASEVGC